MVDYFIVGAGLAGIAFAETALRHGKSIKVFEDDSWHSSQVAGGVYNPVILKRFSGISAAQEQLDTMIRFYRVVDKRLGQNFNYPMPILRKFSSVEEQNNWVTASDKTSMVPFLSTELVTRSFDGIESPFHYGQVLQTGFVDTLALVKSYRKFLKQNEMLVNDSFDYSSLTMNNHDVSYNGLKARHVIFAEGFGIRRNPFFNYLPLAGTKGELLQIRSTELKLSDAIVKSDVFIVPIGNGVFKVGATYEWTDKTESPTKAGKLELTDKLEKLIRCPYEIIDHVAGIRPTVKDRKALIGTHPEYNHFHVLNGLGTRGVMLGPLMAELLFDHIEHSAAIPSDVNIERFRDALQHLHRNE